jgi:hypothetical protein
MTKYLDPTFSVHPGASEKYRENFDSVFSKEEDKTKKTKKQPTKNKPVKKTKKKRK